MFKKLIAAGATLAVALGIVALVAAPAQAHAALIHPTVQCESPTTAKITWSVSNDYGLTSQIFNYTSTGQVDPTPTGTTFTKNGTTGDTHTFTQIVTGNATFNLGIFMRWSDGFQNNNNSGQPQPFTSQVTTNAQTYAGCLPNVTPPQISYNDGICTGPGTWSTAGYTIPSSSAYTVSQSTDGTNYSPIGSGPQTTTAGTHLYWKAVPNGTANLTSTNMGDHLFTQVGGHDCDQAPTLPQVIVTTPVCTANGVVGTGTVSITGISPSVTVSYSTTGKNGAYTTITTDTPVTVPAQTSVWVQIVNKAGYTAVNTITEYAVKGPSTAFCVTPASSIAQVDTACTQSDPGKVLEHSYTIPSSTGVIYSVGGKPVSAGPYNVSVNANAPVTVIVTAVPDTANGYQFPTGTPNPKTYTLTFNKLSSAGCVFPAAIAIPQFYDSRCDTAHPGTASDFTYVLPQVDGVLYHVNGATTTTAPGTYKSTAGATVTITEEAAPGWSLAGDYPAKGYSNTFGAGPGDCLSTVKVAQPTLTEQTCTPDPTNGNIGVYTTPTLLIPAAVDHVTGYLVDGNPVAFGSTVKVKEGVQHTVTVTFETGYKASPDSNYPVGGWTITPKVAPVCGDIPTHPLVAPEVNPDPAGCFTQGGYTLTSDQAPADAVIWTVNGSPVAQGPYQLAAGKVVTITAKPAAGYGFAGPDSVMTFTFTGPSVTGTCDLKTLALTGIGNASAFLGFGYLAVIAGLSLIAVAMIRRRRSTEE